MHMFTKLTRMANRSINFIGLNKTKGPEFIEDGRTGMTQTSVLQRSGGDHRDVGMVTGGRPSYCSE
jgi:hypothetical protein